MQYQLPNFHIDVTKNYLIEQKKFEVCWSLLKIKRLYLTDVMIDGVFEQPRIIDVFDVENNLAYVILAPQDQKPGLRRGRGNRGSVEVQFIYLTPYHKEYVLSLSRRKSRLEVSRRKVAVTASA